MLKLGIIGAGIMGERLVRAAHGQPGVTITGIWDPAASALARPGRAGPAQRRCRDRRGGLRLHRLAAGNPPSRMPARRSRPARPCSARSRWPWDMADAERFTADASGARVAVNFPFASSLAVEQLGRWLAGSEPEGGDHRRRLRHLAAGLAACRRDLAGRGRRRAAFTREVVSHFLFLARRLFGPLRLLEASCHIPDPGAQRTRHHRPAPRRHRAGHADRGGGQHDGG